MRIGFVISRKRVSDSLDTDIVDIAYKWKEIEKWAKEKDIITPSRNWYEFIKALSLNSAFVTEITTAREKCGLSKKMFPDSPPFAKFKRTSFSEFIDEDSEPASPKEQRAIKKRAAAISRESKRIANKFSLSRLHNLKLGNLIEHGFIDPVPQFDDCRFEIQDGEVHIIISKPTITRNAIISYIERECVYLDRMLQKIDISVPDLNISDRFFDVVALKDEEKLPYADIADEISSKYRPNDGQAKINEDSVRVGYKRAKDQILALFPKH